MATRLRKRIAAGREMVRPAHDVDARALGDQREHRERVGILAADQPAHRAELAGEGAEGVAVAAHVHQPLADRRHDLLVLADERAVRADIDLRVEHGAGGLRQLLAHADHHVGVGVARGRAQRLGLRARDLDRILEQLEREPVGERAGRGVVVVPDRMRRDEAFRKADHARAVCPRLADQPAGLFGRALAVEKHRSGLHRRHFHLRIAVTHCRSRADAIGLEKRRHRY